MTLTSGFVNTFTYVNHGQVFVSFHTGNLIRLAMSFHPNNLAGLFSYLVPVFGALFGSVLGSLIMSKSNNTQETTQHFNGIFILAYLVLVFIQPDQFNGIILFALSALMMMQLTGFRFFKGVSFNSTIMTGNLRNLGEYIADFIFHPSPYLLRRAVTYLLLLLCFPVGAFLGYWLSLHMAQYSIIICIVTNLLVILRIRSSESDLG